MYEDVKDDELNAQLDPLSGIPTTTFQDDVKESKDELAAEQEAPDVRPRPMLPLGHVPVVDRSEAIPHIRSNQIPSKFKMSLGMWCQAVSISRNDYKGLRDILRQLEPHSLLRANLPKSFSTLQRHVRSALPLLPLRKQEVSLIPQKMPTATEGSKKPRTLRKPLKATQDLVFFDIKAVLSVYLSTDEVYNKMHKGMAEFVNKPTEL